MSVESHLVELHRKHGELERKINEMVLHPSVDDLEVANLKRRKLKIKDEINKLESETRH